ncbi:MAG: spermidine/putrescine ABC transporter substrate-binding protein [Magnetococcus sp. DMHC-6]
MLHKTFFYICSIFILIFWSPFPSQSSENKELVLLNWSDYMDPDLLQKFEQKSGIHVREVYFETDETRDELLSRTNGQGFDLAIVAANRVENYVKQGWLVPLESQLIGNMKHIASRWLEAYSQANPYHVPLLWGTLGIAYRTDLVEEVITKWAQLLTPAERFRKHILMVKDSRDLAGIAMKALGYSWNSEDEAALQAAKTLLLAQKPFVHDYGYPSLDEKSGLVTGSTWIATMYNGDVIALQTFEPRIAYVVPEEGTNLWVDSLVVFEKSMQKQLAFAFIDFLHEPENSAQLAQYLHYATVNQAAENLLPQTYRNDPTIYPPTAILSRSEFTQRISPKVESKFKNILRSLLN